MLPILGWLTVGVVTLMICVNALYMLFSPQACFRLPPWIRASGTLRAKEYASAGSTIGLRLTGAVLLTVVGWVIF